MNPKRATRDWTDARAKVEAEGVCRVRRWDMDGACWGKLEAGHVIERRFDPDPEYVRAVDVVPLCLTHHQAYDARALDLLPYLTVLEQSAAVEKVGLVRALRRVSPTPQGDES